MSDEIQGETAEDSAVENGPSPSSQLEALAAERDRYRELALRTRAEFENYQKRAGRDLQTERQYAVQPLAAELLPVLDNLERAIGSAKSIPEASGVVEGIELVVKQFLDTFAKHGIERIIPTDQLFDPNFHQAVLQYPTADKPPMTVLQTLQTGYRLKERVLRPAQVMVATPPLEEAGKSPSGDKTCDPADADGTTEE